MRTLHEAFLAGAINPKEPHVISNGDQSKTNVMLGSIHP